MLKKIISYLYHRQNDTPSTSIQVSQIDPDDGQRIISICFSLTSKGSVYIDMQNKDKDLAPVDLANIVYYTGSYSGQLDTLEIIKENMRERDKEEYLEKFLSEYGILKQSELMSLDEQSKKPCINPLEML